MIAPVHRPKVYPDKIMSVEYRGMGAARQEKNRQGSTAMNKIQQEQRKSQLTKCGEKYQTEKGCMAELLVYLKPVSQFVKD